LVVAFDEDVTRFARGKQHDDVALLAVRLPM
jgi:hypothetical protein